MTGPRNANLRIMARAVLRPVWPTDRRLYALALFGCTLVLVGTAFFIIVLALNWGPDFRHVLDFTAFWAAASMTLNGQPSLAYDWEAHRAVEEAALGGSFTGVMPWHYPPVFQVLVTPFGLLPPFAAHAFWVILTLSFYLGVVNRIMPGRTPLLAAMIPAPFLMLVVNGQTGFLIAALIGLTLLNLDRRPVAAGVALGFAALKPHLVIAFPIALAATGKWRMLAVSALTIAALAGVSILLLGAGTWVAFFDSLGHTATVFTDSGNKWHLYASLYGRLRLAGFDLIPAVGAQAVLSVGTMWFLVCGMRSPSMAPDVQAALIAYASIAIAPRVLDYDILTLYIGALFQIRHARSAGFFPGEMLVLGLALAVTFADLLLPHDTGLFLSDMNFLLAPLLMAALLAGEKRREAETAREPATGMQAADAREPASDLQAGHGVG
ncbi:DUF2029 domain-containing protein [Limibaculum sp. M0105]|uniref:DUF2029 domain-containing protein n=1 Tax=Thermohalobaculum xanthum TaxID=2753746 RepID=A0A8J7M792_9RHOB|nr:glycosyltransferase family 87 protein [Thermohalobaculum xanthum]MBK0399593.1 DUF2029 domain-containing protein [Thermohalobaculum xanthum]